MRHTADLEDLQKAGALLKGYRNARDLSQAALAERLKVTYVTIYNWESGNSRILLPLFTNQKKREPNLIRELQLSDAQALELMTLSYPELKPLDKDWLSQKPSDKQAGLLFCAFRTRAGLTQKEAASLLDVSWSSVKQWETGRSPINIKQCSKDYERKFCKVLAISMQEFHQLQELNLHVPPMSARDKEQDDGLVIEKVTSVHIADKAQKIRIGLGLG